jgi:hypothetical protein
MNITDKLIKEVNKREKINEVTSWWFMHFSKLALDDVITEMIRMKFAYDFSTEKNKTDDEEYQIHFRKLKYMVETIVRDSVDL